MGRFGLEGTLLISGWPTAETTANCGAPDGQNAVTSAASSGHVQLGGIIDRTSRDRVDLACAWEVS